MEIISHYQLDRIRRKKENKDFDRSLGIEMRASVRKGNTVENSRRRRTRAVVLSGGPAMVGRTISTRSAEPRDTDHGHLIGKEERKYREAVRVGMRGWSGRVGR